MIDTIKSINNDQEAFEFVKNHLLYQGVKSMEEENYGCAYRGVNLEDPQDHISCAVGCLISDSAYHPDLEQKAADDQDVQQAIQESNPDWKLTSHSIYLLMNLQFIHDRIAPELWPFVFGDPINITIDDLSARKFSSNFNQTFSDEYNGTSTSVDFVDKFIELGMAKVGGWDVHAITSGIHNYKMQKEASNA